MASLLQAMLANESGGRNIPNVHEGTSSGQAQGFFQITTGTWDDFGGRKYAPNPLQATYAQQAEIASKIPLKRWDPSTLAKMRATGIGIDPNRTLGENLSAAGEGFGSGPEGGPAAVAGRYDPRRDTPSSAHPTGEQVSQYALKNPVGPEGDTVTTSPYDVPNSPYTLPAPGTADNPLITKEVTKNPFATAGAAIAKLGDRSPQQTLGPIQTPQNLAMAGLPAMPGVDPAASNNQRNMLIQAMMRLNSGQLWPSQGGGIG